MKNKRLLIRKYLPIFLVLVCLSGCVKSHRPISERLLKAEEMMDCHQTGAYQLLKTLQPEVIDWSEEQQMRYWTDYVDAKNKDIYHLDGSDLKRLEELLSYHQKKRNGDEVVRVLYLLGSAKRDTEQMSDAIELWLQGAYSSDGQPKTKALIYEQLTSAYYYRFLFDEGRTFNDSALHYARMTGDSAMIADVLVDRCALFQFQQKPDSVLAYTDAISGFYARHGDGYRAANAVVDAIFIYNERKDWQQASRYLAFYEKNCGLFDKNGVIEKGYEIYYYMKGMCLLNLGQLDSAAWCFRQEQALADDWNNRQAASKGLTEYFKAINQTDSALYYAQLRAIAADSAYLEQNNRQLQQIEAQYNENYYKEQVRERERETEQYKRGYMMFIIILISIMFLVILVVLWWRSRIKVKAAHHSRMIAEKEAAIAKMELQLDAMLHDQETAHQQIEEARLKIQALTKELEKNTENLERKQLIRREYIGTSEEVVNLKQKAYIGQIATEQDTVALRQCFSAVYPQFVDRLCELYARISEDEIMVCIYNKLRFSNKSIATLMDKRPSAISNIRARLFEKIHGKRGSANEITEWLDSLS